MDFATRFQELQKRVLEHREVLLTEEAAKTALIMPMLQALGYDVFDPKEVVPEFTADVSTKKGEKVDYAVFNNGKLGILIECKPASTELSVKNAGQLFRYFACCDARLAILTNGVNYQFYSDLEAVNKMDEKPFFSFSLDALKSADIRTLEKFSKDRFSVDVIVQEAVNLKLQGLVRQALESELRTPSDELVRLLASKVADGRVTPALRSNVERALPGIINNYIRDLVTDRLSSALAASKPTEDEQEVGHSDEATMTTEEEIQGFRIVQAIIGQVVAPRRLVMRDSKSYCALLLDDNNRRTVARLHFDGISRKYLGVFKGKEETRHLISDLTDIYLHSEALRERAAELDGENGGKRVSDVRQ